MSTNRAKSRHQLEAENDQLKFMLNTQSVGVFWESMAKIVVTLIKWGSAVAIAWFIYLSITTLAGQTTIADFSASANVSLPSEKLLGSLQDGVEKAAATVLKEWLADSPFTAIAWAVALVMCWYARRERKLRKDTVERLQNRITELEKGKDPNRTSSGITPRGDTQPGDK